MSSRFPKNDLDLARHQPVLTCALDPRFKSLKFLTDEQRQLVKSNLERFDTPAEHLETEVKLNRKTLVLKKAKGKRSALRVFSWEILSI